MSDIDADPFNMRVSPAEILYGPPAFAVGSAARQTLASRRSNELKQARLHGRRVRRRIAVDEASRCLTDLNHRQITTETTNDFVATVCVWHSVAGLSKRSARSCVGKFSAGVRVSGSRQIGNGGARTIGELDVLGRNVESQDCMRMRGGCLELERTIV